MATLDIKSRTRDVFRGQCGLVTRAQALQLGYSASAISRLLASGTWRRLYPSVFAHGLSDPSWHQRVLAACLSGGDGTVASHRSAARLAALDGCDFSVVEVSSRRRIQWAGVVGHRIDLQPWEMTRIARIPSTSVARSLIDLATVVGENAAESALDSALRRGLVSIDYLQRQLARYARLPAGGPVVAKLLRERGAQDSVSESPLETAFLQLVRRARLPLPVSQYEVWERERFIARVDFAYPERRVAIECDGYEWHQGRQRWQRDVRRDRVLARAGWRVIHVTYWDLRECPDEIIATVRHALGIAPLFANG